MAETPTSTTAAEDSRRPGQRISHLLPLDKAPRLAWIMVVLVAAAVWQPSLWHDFLFWDDEINVTSNPLLLESQPWDMMGATWIFDTERVSAWRPLNWLLYAVLFWSFGLNPFPFHLVSVLLHLTSAGLVCSVTGRLLGQFWGIHAGRSAVIGAIVALLWALHPQQVEAVSWISALAYPQGMFFLLLSVLAVLEHFRQSGWRRPFYLGVAVVGSWFAVLSHPLFLSAPLVLAALYLVGEWRQRPFGSWAGRLVRMLPLGLGSAVGSLLSFFVVYLISSPGSRVYSRAVEDSSLTLMLTQWLQLASSSVIFWELPVIALIWPWNRPVALYFLAFPIVCVAFFWAAHRLRLPWLVRGLLPGCYLLMLLPAAGDGSGAMFPSARYTYGPSIFLAAMLTTCLWAVAKILARRAEIRRDSIVAGCLALVLCLSFIVVTLPQQAHWRNTLSLMDHALTTLRGSRNLAGLHYRRGVALLGENRIAEGMTALDSALTEDPEYFPARLVRAQFYLIQKRHQLARIDLEALMAQGQETPRIRELLENLPPAGSP